MPRLALALVALLALSPDYSAGEPRKDESGAADAEALPRNAALLDVLVPDGAAVTVDGKEGAASRGRFRFAPLLPGQLAHPPGRGEVQGRRRGAAKRPDPGRLARPSVALRAGYAGAGAGRPDRSQRLQSWRSPSAPTASTCSPGPRTGLRPVGRRHRAAPPLFLGHGGTVYVGRLQPRRQAGPHRLVRPDRARCGTHGTGKHMQSLHAAKRARYGRPRSAPTASRSSPPRTTGRRCCGTPPPASRYLLDRAPQGGPCRGLSAPTAGTFLTGSVDGTARAVGRRRPAGPVASRGTAAPSLPSPSSPDGKRVLTGSEDGTAAMWDAAGGKEPQDARAAQQCGPRGRVQPRRQAGIDRLGGPDGRAVGRRRRPARCATFRVTRASCLRPASAPTASRC